MVTNQKSESMRERLICILGALCIAIAAYAEEPQLRIPDEEDIIHQTLAPGSPYYYTNLMLKYRNGNERLSDEEYYYLYYGFLYQEDYRPFTENRALDQMLAVVSGIDPERPTVGQLEAIVESGTEAMELDPFNPKVLNMLAYAYGALDDPQREELYFNHLNGILRAIESSGTGRKEVQR